MCKKFCRIEPREYLSVKLLLSISAEDLLKKKTFKFSIFLAKMKGLHKRGRNLCRAKRCVGTCKYVQVPLNRPLNRPRYLHIPIHGSLSL